MRNNKTSKSLTDDDNFSLQGNSMEKRRTLERLQKFGLGRRAGSTESQRAAATGTTKTEKLRELTERLVKAPRSSTSPNTATPPVPPPLPPPIPPPIPLRFKRKQRTLDSQRSVESESDTSIPESHEKVDKPISKLLRPIVSTSNLEALDHKKMLQNETSKSTDCLHDEELFTKVVRPEAKQIIGSYTQSTIPFRSASFSQADTNKNYKKIDRFIDTNRYPEISELSLNLTQDGCLENIEKAVEAIEAEVKPQPLELKLKQASEMTLEPLVEEEAPLTPTTDDLQQATTCLIPIPVYDSVVKEWSTTSPSEQWINPENPEIKPDELQEVIEKVESEAAEPFTPPDTQYSIELPESPELKEKQTRKKPDHLVLDQVDDVSSQELQSPVRKRQSNNDLENSLLASESEEKRRLDKSKRRKGIYIQWPALEKSQELNQELSLNNQDEKSPWTPDVFSNDINLSDLSKIAIISDESQRKISDCNSLSSGDPPTPDVEKTKPVFRAQSNQRSSLAYQSSDEKDDVSEMSTPPLRQFKNLFIRGDSVSDNESDRAHSRDRASASPAPEYDWKRYSKRPLRGPYGQMLEAEMKKPSPKVHYEEILEELNKSEP